MKLQLSALVLVASCASCNSIRSIDVCLINDAQHLANCALKDVKYIKQYPSQMLGYSAFDKVAMSELGDKLVQCDTDGRLPSGDSTLSDMHICQITASGCGDLSLSSLDGYYAVPPSSLQKIKDKLSFCTR